MRWVSQAALLIWAVAAAQPNLTVWTYAPSDVELTWLRQQAEVHGSETGVAVDVLHLEFDDLRRRLTTGGGDLPDLVATVPHDWLPELVEAGTIVPLNDLVDPAVLAATSELALDAFSANGARYGLPVAIEGVALIYDRALVGEAPATWDEFAELARSSPQDGRFGFLYPFADPYFSYGWWHAYGGYVFAPTDGGGWNETDIGLGGHPGYAAATLLRDLRHGSGILPAQADYGFVDEAFITGKTPMILNGPWALADYRRAGIDVGVAPVPTPPGAARPWGPLVGVQGIVIGADAADPAAAVALAAHLASPEAAADFRAAGGIRIPVQNTDAFGEDPVTASFAAVLTRGAVMPAIAAMADVWTPWRSAILRVTGTADTDVMPIIDDLETRLRH